MVLALEADSGEAGRWRWLGGGRISQIIALELWDFESWYDLAAGQVRFARSAGAFVHLQSALNYLARAHILVGDLATAALMAEEDQLIAAATGTRPVAQNTMMIAAWRGQEREASELIEATVRSATARGVGRPPASRPTRARCCTTAWAGTTPRGTPRGGPPSVTCWATGLLSYPSWPSERTWWPSTYPASGIPSAVTPCCPRGRWPSSSSAPPTPSS